VLVVDKGDVSPEKWWNCNNRGKKKVGYSEKNASQCYFAHHEYYMGWSGI